MSAENEPVECQEWLGDDSMTITSGTINITGVPINAGAPPLVSQYIGATAYMSEIEKELKAWRERFPEYTYNWESGLIGVGRCRLAVIDECRAERFGEGDNAGQ